MRVRIDGLPAFTAGELIHRHTRLPALDVPQCLIHTAESIVQHRAVLPVRTVVARLPDILDPVCRLTHKKRLQILFHRRLDQVSALGERGATVAVKSILIGGDFNHREPRAGRLALDHANILDARCCHAPSGARNLLLRSQKRRSSSKHARTPDGLQQCTTVH
jgi:endonuclease/exonuclease/phosphatase (EEP) superfamily protein YafD